MVLVQRLVGTAGCFIHSSERLKTTMLYVQNLTSGIHSCSRVQDKNGLCCHPEIDKQHTRYRIRHKAEAFWILEQLVNEPKHICKEQRSGVS
jgi:hypothetical protein